MKVSNNKYEILWLIIKHQVPFLMSSLNERGGMEFKCRSDLPQSNDQIKYKHPKISKKGDVDKMVTLLQMA